MPRKISNVLFIGRRAAMPEEPYECPACGCTVDQHADHEPGIYSCKSCELLLFYLAELRSDDPFKSIADVFLRDK